MSDTPHEPRNRHEPRPEPRHALNETPEPRDPVEMAADRPRLLSSTMVMASGTLVSRILGGVRVLLVGYLLTVSMPQSDMYALATEIPTAAYTLLAGGVLTAILLPQLMRAMNTDADGGQAFSDRIVTLFGLLLITLTLLLTVGTPLVIRLMSDAKWRTPGMTAQYHSLLMLTALCMPQVFFYGVFFLASQLLNARSSFGPVAWAPVANNIVQILMLGTYAVVWGFHTDTSQPFTTEQMLLLGLGSVAGVAVQSIILIPYLKKVGFRYHPRFDFLHTGLGRTAQVAKWALALVAIDQVNYIVITRLASRATVSGHGAGIAAFNSAMWISIVPHSLLTVSLVTVLMPSLSTLSVTGQWERFAGQFQSSIRTVYAAIIPIACLLGTMGVPIATTAFSAERGGAYVGWTLAVLGVGLIPFTLRYLVNKGFNAMENTRTPFMMEIIFVVVTCLVSIVLILVVKIPAVWVAPSIALGYSLGYLVSASQAFRRLRKAVPNLAAASLGAHTVRLICISLPGAALAGVICWLQNRYISGLIPSLLGLVVAGLVGIGVYWGLARLIHISEVQDLETLIRSKLRKEKSVESVEPSSDIGSDTSAMELVFGSDETQPILTGLAPLEQGVLIAGRYRLGRMVCRIGSATRWEGTDESLSRPIFITAFPNDEHSMAILDAARVASGVMDARFLRILDAGQDADGAYIVSEWGEGRTLSEVLASGPLSGEESAWVVREVAAGLASVHALQIYHCRLDPTKIMITTQGSVKITGLRVDQALTPRENDAQLSRHDMESMDVFGCGGLLYACLTATWPGSSDVGLGPSPRNQEGLQSPIHVRPGTSITLDRLTRQMLSVSSDEHISTAHGIVEELNGVLGTADPTASLAAKASASHPEVRHEPGKAVRPHILPAGSAHEDRTVAMTGVIAGAGGAGIDTGARGARVADDEGTTEATGAVEAETTSSGTGAGEVGPTGEGESEHAVKLRHPIQAAKATIWSRVFFILIILVVLSLVTALIVGLYNSSRNKEEDQGESGPATETVVHPILGAAIFDSPTDGGDGMENDADVKLAYDGDPATAWTTEVYPATWIPERKTGVGLLLDLGSPLPVSEISLTMDLTPVTLSVLVPGGDPSTVTEPDMRSVADWTTLATQTVDAAQTTITVDQTTTQFVLVYFTTLAPKDTMRQADIAEVSVSG